MTPFPFLDFTQVMARLKNKEVPESADEIKNVDTAPEATPEDVVTENVDTNTNDDKLPQDPAPEEKKEKKTSKRGSKSESQATPEVPASVDAILKKFSQYDELYVDSTGCVYTKDTQPSIIGGAILYKNPYYN